MRSPGGRLHRWGYIVRVASRSPGAWVVKLPDEPTRLVRTINDRAAPELRFEGGRLEAKAVNVYRNAWGHRRGDVYIRMVPYDNHPQKEEHDVHQEPGSDRAAEG
jgi:hypothetical protein